MRHTIYSELDANTAAVSQALARKTFQQSTAWQPSRRQQRSHRKPSRGFLRVTLVIALVAITCALLLVAKG